jgi:hypothetical protein
MSIFQRWSREAHKTLSARGLKVSYAQVQQLLAGGLGHPSLHSFQKADLQALEHAAFAVFDEARMLGRAKPLGIALTDDISNDLCMDLREIRGGPMLIRARYFEHPARGAFPSADPAVDMFAREVNTTLPDHAVEMSQVLRAEPIDEFREGCSWVWSMRGTSLALRDGDDYEVPFAAHVEFPSIGTRLLSNPFIHSVRPSGPPAPWDDDVTDFAYVSESDS